MLLAICRVNTDWLHEAMLPIAPRTLTKSIRGEVHKIMLRSCLSCRGEAGSPYCEWCQFAFAGDDGANFSLHLETLGLCHAGFPCTCMRS